VEDCYSCVEIESNVDVGQLFMTAPVRGAEIIRAVLGLSYDTTKLLLQHVFFLAKSSKSDHAYRMVELHPTSTSHTLA
jgi:hypothetical protein